MNKAILKICKIIAMGAMIMNQIMPNLFLFQNNIAHALVTDGYNLAIVKSVVTSNPQPGQAIVYRLSYSNLSGDAISGVTIVDTYGSGLTYNSVVSSSPTVSAPVHNVSAKTITFSNISLPANTTGTIDIEFSVSAGVVGGSVENAAICSAGVQNCVAQTIKGTKANTFTVAPESLPQNNNVDLEINKYHGDCPIGGGGGGGGNDLGCYLGFPNGMCNSNRGETPLNCVSDCGASCTNTQSSYASGDDVYFTVEYKNNGTSTATNVAIVDFYDKSFSDKILSFDSVVSESNPGLIGNPHAIGNRISFSDGFTLTPGQVGNVVLKFKVLKESGRKYLYNYAEIGSMRQSAQIGGDLKPRGDTNPSIQGVQQTPPYSLHNLNPYSTLLQINNETAQTNNFTQVQITLPTYDLQVTKELIAGTPGRGAEVTFRVEIDNGGPARKNLRLIDHLKIEAPSGEEVTPILISYSAGPGIVLNGPSKTGTDMFDTTLDVSANSNGYIDMTFKYPEGVPTCDQPSTFNVAKITLAGFVIDINSNGDDLVEEGNDTDTGNNTFILDLGPLPWITGSLCGFGGEFDYSIVASSPTTTNLCPGEIITITNSVSKDSNDNNLDSYPRISANLNNSTALANNNLIYLGTTSVGPASRRETLDRNAGYMQNFLTNLNNAMNADLPNKILDTRYNPAIPTASEMCPDWYGIGGFGRTLFIDANNVFKDGFYDKWNTLTSNGTIPSSTAFFQSIAQAFAEQYQFIKNLNYDEPLANQQYQECALEIETEFFVNRFGMGRVQARNMAISLGILNIPFNPYAVMGDGTLVAPHDYYIIAGNFRYGAQNESLFDLLSKFRNPNETLIETGNVNYGIDPKNIVYAKVLSNLGRKPIEDTPLDLKATEPKKLGQFFGNFDRFDTLTFDNNCADGVYNSTAPFSGCDFGNQTWFNAENQGAYLSNPVGNLKTLQHYNKNHKRESSREGITLESKRDVINIEKINNNPERIDNQPEFDKDYGYLLPADTTEEYKVQFIVPNVPNGTVLNYEGIIGSNCDPDIMSCLTDNNSVPYTIVPEYDHNNNESPLTFTVNCSNPNTDRIPELSTTINTSNTTINLGDTVVYTITYCNDGIIPLIGGSLNLFFDENLIYLSLNGQLPPTRSINGNEINLSSIDLNPGECKSFNANFIAGGLGNPKVDVEFGKDFGNGFINYYVESNTNNNNSEQTITIINPVNTPILPAFSKNLNTTLTNTTGEAISYTISYQNTSSDSHTVDFTDIFNINDLAYVSSSITPSSVNTTSGTIQWNGQTVNAGNTLSINVNFTLQRVLKAAENLMNSALYEASFGNICTNINDEELNNNSSRVNTAFSGSTPINGVCSGGIIGNTYYSGTLPNTGDLCASGTLSNLNQTSTGRTWSCFGTGGGTNQTGCSITLSYCGDGVLGTGNGYANEEQYDDGNNIDGDGVSSTCQYEAPTCTVGLTFTPNAGSDPLLTTGTWSTESWATTTFIDFGDASSQNNPTSPIGHMYNGVNTYTASITVASTITGSTLTGSCTGTVVVSNTPINGMCNATMINQTYYTGNLPNTADLCASGTLTGLTETSTGWTWSCEGINGGTNDNACTLAISYCGDGVLGTGNGYANEEQYDDGNNIDGDGVSSTCQYEAPSCVGVNFAPTAGAPGLEVFATLPSKPGFIYTNLDRTEIIINNPVNGTSHIFNNVGLFPISVTVSNSLNTGISINCTGSVNISNSPINGMCNATMINQTYYTGNLPNTADLCASGTLTGLTETSTGWTWSCEGINGGTNDNACTLAISYCGDGIIGTGIGYVSGTEVCEPANTATCDLMCQPIIAPSSYDLALIKQVSGSTTNFVSGDTLTFNITVTNQGAVDASGVMITDYIPAGLTLADPAWSDNGNTATFIAPLSISTGASQVISITFIVNGSVTGSILNRSEISDDNGNDIDSTPDTTNGTGSESTLDDEVNNASGDEDDHDRAEITVIDGPINGMCNATMINQTYYTGNLPNTADLCASGTLTGLTETSTGWTWSCEGINGGTNDNACTLAISYCGDGIIGTGIGYVSGTEVCEPANTATCDLMCQPIIAPSSYDLALIKQVSGSTTNFVSGDTLTFNITVTNQGAEDASGVMITDYIPAGLTLADAAWSDNGNTATFIAPLSIATGASQVISITFIVNGSVTGSILNRSEISDDNGNDIDSTSDTTNGTGSESTLDDEVNNASGDEDDHDRAEITVIDGPINGMCNATMINQTYYTGNLPNTADLCASGTLTGLTETSTGWTWSCEGINGGTNDNACTLAISYCGDGVLGTGNGYANEEQYDDGNNIDGDGVSSTCQYEAPSCVGVNFAPTAGAPGLEVFATLPSKPGFIYTNLDRTEIIINNPVNGTSHIFNNVGLFPISVTVSNSLNTGISINCTGSVNISNSPINGMCNATMINQTYYTGNLPNTADLCASGTLTGLTETSTGWTWSCEGINGGTNDNACTLAISYCGDGIIGTGIGYVSGTEVCEPANTATCDLMCQPIIAPSSYDLALIKQVSGSTTNFVSGDTLTFNITVTNQGAVDASGVMITDYIPAGLTLADAAWFDNGTGTATFIAPLSIATGASQVISITFIVNGSVTGSILNRSEISVDDGNDIDSTPDTMNGTGSESTLDNEVNNTSGDEDDHDRAEITVIDTPINGMCNATMINQTFYTGNLPNTVDLCTSGTLTGLTQTSTGWTWSCEGINGGTNDNACSLAISYCGDGVLGTGNGYANEEQYDDGNNIDGDGVSSTCQYEAPTCTVGLTFTPNSGFDPLLTTGTWSTESWATTTFIDFGDASSQNNPTIPIGHIYNGVNTYTASITVASTITGSTLTGSCTGTVVVSNAPINGMCNATMINQTYYTGNLPNTADLCASGTLTGLTETSTGWTWSCEGINGGTNDNACTLAISYCGDGIIGTGIGYVSGTEVCEPANTATCDLMCQPIIAPSNYDLALIKQVSGSTTNFVSGDTLTFNITVTNQGAVDASGVMITDYIPAGLTLADAAWSDNGNTATFIAPLSIATGASQVISITFIVNGSVTGSILNRSEISDDNGNDIDSTPDTTNGTGSESTLDDEVNNASGDEDDHDRAEITVIDGPINGMCNATMINQTYYTGNLPNTADLCTVGTLTGLTETSTGWTWSCEGINGGTNDNACTLAISYCGDGIIGTGIGYNNEEQCDLASSNGSGTSCSEMCTWNIPSCTSLLSLTPDNGYAPLTVSIDIAGAPIRASGSLNYGFGSFDITHPSYSTSVQYLTSAAYNVMYTITNPNNGSGETCTIVVNVSNAPIDGSCGPMGAGAGSSIYDFDNNGNSLTGGSIGLCATGMASGFTYDNTLHTRSRVCEGQYGGVNPSCSATELYCGNTTIGTNEPGEMCDEGLLTTQACYGRTDVPAGQTACMPTVCGDGIPQNLNGAGLGGLTNIGDEQCDMGSSNSDTTPDACRVNCVMPTCGDGIADPKGNDGIAGTSDDEECDMGSANSLTGSCSPTCKLTYCGDTTVQQPNGNTGTQPNFIEGCDDGMSGSSTCYGPTDPNTPAGKACTLTTCGDGLVQTNNGEASEGATNIGDEQCDDMNTNEFDGCTASCVIQLCEINGYVYGDITNNNLFDSLSDLRLGSQTITLTGATGMWTTTTDVNGFYSFTDLDCQDTYTVSFTNGSVYKEDSAQLEQTTQQSSTNTIIVAPSLFQDTANLYSSPDNNFGLVQYDLSIAKTFVSTMGLDGVLYPLLSGTLPVVESGDIVTYHITFTHTGITVANNVQVTDMYDASHLSFVSASAVSIPVGGSLPTVNSSSAGILSRDFAVLTPGDSYTVAITMKVVGNNADVVHNAATIYTSSLTGDSIEDAYSSSDDFANNTTSVDTVVQSCFVDGYVYLDIANDNIFNGSDVAQANQAITCNGGQYQALRMDTTDGNGYYSCEPVSCRYPVTVSYVETTPYLADSAQHEMNNQQVSATSIIVPATAFTDGYKSVLASEDNNFGVTLYNLAIKKELVRQQSQQRGGSPIPVKYKLTITNNGPTTAYDAVIADVFDSTLLAITASSVTMSGPTAAIPTTLPLASIAGNVMTLAALPVLAARETVIVNYDGNIIGFNGSSAVNTGSVYVGTPETDVLESGSFVDNKDKAEAIVILPGASTPYVPTNPDVKPDPIVDIPQTIEVVKNIIKKVITNIKDELFEEQIHNVAPDQLPATGAE